MKRRILSILLALCMLLTMLPITAMAVMATATNIQVTEAEYYATGALEKITTQFGWAQASVTGRLVLQTQRLRSAGETGTNSSYGDFTNYGHYASDFDSFDDVLAYEEAQDGVFGIVSYSDETAVKNGTDNNTASFEFESSDLPLDKNGLYYVYFWTYYGGQYYPDNLFLVIQVKDGVVSYTPAIEGNGDRNSYDENAFKEIVTEETYDVAVTPGANMTRVTTSGAESQTDLNGSMTPVVYTANAGYEFPETYAVETLGGIMVRRDSASQITVLGKPTTNVSIILPAPSAAAPVQPTEQKILNDNWPYGKDMTVTNVTLTVAVSDPANATYVWYKEVDGGEDLQVGTVNDLELTNPAHGSRYYCVVNGSLTSETVEIVLPDSTWWTKPYSSYYITNGTVAYMVNGVKFDVVGLYTKNNTDYMLNTSYRKCWDMYSSTSPEPIPKDVSDISGDAQLDDLWVAFDKSDSCAVYFMADLAEGQRAFSFGTDTQLGNDTTSGYYDDNAALIAELDDSDVSVLKHISMIGAASEDDAKASDPSFVIAPAAQTPADRFWIGYYGYRETYAYNDDASGEGYTPTNINGANVTTAVENHDSGMTMSWLDVESGGTVGFLFKVGKVADTGATETPDVEDVTVTFRANGQGTAPAAQTVAAGETAAEPTAPTAAGYTFGGWYTDAACTTAWNFSNAVNEDLDLYAKWTVNQYTVKFYGMRNVLLDEQTVNYGEAAVAPTPPEVEGYKFIAWDSSSYTNVKEDLEIVAVYQVQSYMVVFKDWNGNVLKSEEVLFGNGIQAPQNPVREGYTFTGWSPEVPGSMPGRDMTFTAQYSASQYTIKWIVDGAEDVDTYAYGAAVTAPADPTKTGYTFAGWGATVPATMPAENLTFTAQWTVNNYTVKWIVDGAETTETYAYGAAVTAPADPTKTGYTFAGWGATVPATMPAENLTFTAQYSINQYTITFVDTGDAAYAPITQDYGTDVAPLADPVKTGYTFAGWDKEIPATMPAEDLTITAQWTINQYTITFESNGGSSVDSITQDYGTAVTEPAAPARNGYGFIDWYEDAELTTVYEFTTMPAEDITLYAKWIRLVTPVTPSTYPPTVDEGKNGDVVVAPGDPEAGDIVVIKPCPDEGYEVDEVIVTDKNGNSVKVTPWGKDAYRFRQPEGSVTVTVTFRKIGECSGDWTCPMAAFADLNRNAWYHDAVHYCLERGLMNGISDTEFAPGMTTSRAMIVTILWRLEGKPVVNYLMGFEDVAADQWYTEAIRWAASEGIVNGYSETAFGPDDAITREQLATILYRYEQYKGGGFTGTWMIRMDYVDLAEVSDWAYEAMCWMNMNGIVNGKPGKVLDPSGSASRAEAAAMLQRYCALP